jgi:hypothetical protein
MRKPRTRTLIATAAVAAATATAGFMIASTAGASTTSTTGTLTAVSGNTGTTLSIAASKSTISIGQQDTVSGTLQASGTAAGHRKVGLLRYSARLNRWRLVRVKETDANGSVQFTVRPLDTAKYELGYRGNGKPGAVRSAALTITVTPSGKLTTSLSIAASPAPAQDGTAKDGSATKITGALTTVDATPVPGRPVVLTRYNPATKKWVRVAVKRTGPKGVVFFVRAPSTTATFELVFPGGPRFAGSHSATVTVTGTGQSGGTTPPPAGSTPVPTGSTAASLA